MPPKGPQPPVASRTRTAGTAPGRGVAVPALGNVAGAALGRGAGARGLGQSRWSSGAGRGHGRRRQRKIIHDNINGITKGDIRRLARRGGIHRISADIYDEIRGVLKAFLQRVMGNTIAVTEHCNRKTVIVTDVIWALRREGRPIVGFGDVPARYNRR